MRLGCAPQVDELAPIEDESDSGSDVSASDSDSDEEEAAVEEEMPPEELDKVVIGCPFVVVPTGVISPTPLCQKHVHDAM